MNLHKLIMVLIWGAWLGGALAGNITDWYWWINIIVLNLAAPFIWGERN